MHQEPGGRRCGPDLRRVVDGMLYVAQTGCQWRFLPESFGPWTRVWSQVRRWSRNGTWARLLRVLHLAVRRRAGRPELTPSMLVIDTHLARGGSNGGATFHDRVRALLRLDGLTPRPATPTRDLAVDVTGLPVGAVMVPASTHENLATELLLVDRGTTVRVARKVAARHASASGWLQVACVAILLRAVTSQVPATELAAA